MMMIRLMLLVKVAEIRDESVPKMFTRTAKRFPDKVMLYFQDRKWTFRDVSVVLRDLRILHLCTT